LVFSDFAVFKEFELCSELVTFNFLVFSESITLIANLALPRGLRLNLVLVLFKLKQNQVQCNLDLVTPYSVTNRDLVTILQKTIFLVHKNISFSDNLVFSATSI
jgi:hypothetical protein